MCVAQSGTLGTYVCAHEEARSQPRVLLSRSYPLCLLRLGPSLWPWSSSVRLAPSEGPICLCLPNQCRCYMCTSTHLAFLQWVLCFKLGFYTWSASTFLTGCLFSPSLPKNALVFDHAIMGMVSSKRFCLVPKPGLPRTYFPHLQTSTHRKKLGEKLLFLSLELKLRGENWWWCDLRGKKKSITGCITFFYIIFNHIYWGYVCEPHMCVAIRGMAYGNRFSSTSWVLRNYTQVVRLSGKHLYPTKPSHQLPACSHPSLFGKDTVVLLLNAGIPAS